MRLMTGTHVNLYGDKTYVMQLRTGYSYLFNETVYDILKILESSPGITADEICERMLEIYGVEDTDSFRRDILECLADLEDKKIIDGETPPPAQARPVPEDLINRICIKNHILQSVTIELTYRCNERCAHCYVADTEKDAGTEMTTEEVFAPPEELRFMDLTITVARALLTMYMVTVKEKTVRIAISSPKANRNRSMSNSLSSKPMTLVIKKPALPAAFCSLAPVNTQRTQRR